MSHRDTHSAIPQTLFDIAGIQARIHSLPGRPPFIIDADAAEVYGTSTKRIVERVKRNADLFPEDFCVRMTPEEWARWSQSATTSAGKRTDILPLCFTHAGMNGLSAVVTTPTGRKMHVVVHRAFAAMEAHAMEMAQKELLALHSQITGRRSLYSHIRDAFREGRSFQDVKDEARRSQREIIEKMIAVMANEKHTTPLRGTPMARYRSILAQVMSRQEAEQAAEEADARQGDLFEEV